MIKKFAEAYKPLNEAKKEKGADIWFSDIAYFKKEHKGYKLKPNDLISIHTPKGDQEMTYAEALKKFESADTVIESKGLASRELIKATDKLHAEQLKLQDLQSKFVAETDTAKKEKLKKQVIDQNKVVKQVERDFQTVLGREEEDIDDMFESTEAGEFMAIAECLRELNNALTEYDIDDILTELEVVTNELVPNTPGRKMLIKEVDAILYDYTKLVNSINKALSGLVK